MTPMSRAIWLLAKWGAEYEKELLAQAKPCPNSECGHSNLELKLSKDAEWIACIDCGFTGPKAVDCKEALKLWDALVRREKDTAAKSYTVD